MNFWLEKDAFLVFPAIIWDFPRFSAYEGTKNGP
jgi:hypothetical protein